MTNPKQVCRLSSRGLANLVAKETDFVFVVGDTEIACSRFQAQFISRRVSDLLSSDPTIDRFEVPVKSASAVSILLSGLISSGEFDVSDASAVADLSRSLGNTELLEICLRSTCDSVDESNVVQRLNVLPIEEEVCFLASHFSSVSSQSGMRSLNVEVLSRVLDNSGLCLESEDALFRFIESVCREDDSYRDLIDFVEAQYLSDLCIGDYIRFVGSDNLSGSVWLSICRRLLLGVTPSGRNPRVKDQSVSFPVPADGSPRFVGILHHLCEECQGNPHVSGKIQVSANDEVASSGLKVYDLISDIPKSGKYWGSGSQAVDHYIKIAFWDSVVRPAGYALKAHNATWGNGYFIRSWRFEGSNDDSNWFTLDAQKNSNAIDGNDREAIFRIATDQSYRFLRIVAEGNNSSGDRQFSMQQIEIFGSLRRQTQK
jgi:hypothetical protein